LEDELKFFAGIPTESITALSINYSGNLKGDFMIKDLVKIAQKLDSIGMKKEADAIDSIIRKVATKREEDVAFSDIESNRRKRYTETPSLEEIDFSPTDYRAPSALSTDMQRFEGSPYEESARNEFRRLKNKFPNLSKKVNPDHFVQEYCALRESRDWMRSHTGGSSRSNPYDFGEKLLIDMVKGNTWGGSMPE
jgi:hypothetical protein